MYDSASTADQASALLARPIDGQVIDELRVLLGGPGGRDRAVVERLFAVRDVEASPAWTTFFTQEVCRFVSQDDQSPEMLDDAEAAWLVEQIGPVGHAPPCHLALLARLMEALRRAPPSFVQYVLDQMRAAVRAAGSVDDARLEWIRAVVRGEASGGRSRIDHQEAEFLLQVNADSAGSPANAQGWPALFVDLMTRYFLSDVRSPGAISSDEGEFLLAHVDRSPTDPNLLSLVSSLRLRAMRIDGRLATHPTA